MKKFGISIYPAHSSWEKDYEYLKKASRLGYSRLFMCLLSEKDNLENIIKKYKNICDHAHALGFEISVDTNFEVFKRLNANAFDLRVFKEIGIDIIRLDGPFTNNDYVAMTNNPFGIKIEFNGCTYLNLDYLIEIGANKNNMTVCANFYPQRHTAIDMEQYIDFCNRFRSMGIRNAAFVSSNNENTFGPWEVYEGLVTVEECRDMDICDQARLLVASGVVDDIFIGNCYASDDELERLSKIDLNTICLKMEENNLSEEESKILYGSIHFRRLDCGKTMIRSSFTRNIRLFYVPFKKHVDNKVRCGSVAIVNDNLKHYGNEVQILLKDIDNDDTRNVVGYLNDFEMKLVSFIKVNQIFKFIK